MTADMILTHVEAITVREVAGEGQQADLIIKGKKGRTTILRVISPPNRVLRITDLPQRDRRERAKRASKTVAAVPMREVAR